MPFCPECGKPVAPKARFCRNCDASQLDGALAGVVPVDAPVAPTVAAPVPAARHPSPHRQSSFSLRMLQLHR